MQEPAQQEYETASLISSKALDKDPDNPLHPIQNPFLQLSHNDQSDLLCSININMEAGAQDQYSNPFVILKVDTSQKHSEHGTVSTLSPRHVAESPPISPAGAS